MLESIQKETSSRELPRVWLEALEETARDFYPKPKEFCRRAYEHATETWLRILEEEYGMVPDPASTIKEGVESHIKIGVEAGLFHDPGEFVLQEETPDKLNVTVVRCIYKKVCQDMVKEGFSVKNLTCPRIGCFRAAVLNLTGIDAHYEVTNFEEDGVCEGFIEAK